MTGYEKKIAYFDLVENGQRIGNAGFAKIIFQNGQLRLTTNISGLHKTDTLKTEILFVTCEKDIKIDTIHIKEGRCVYSRLFTEDELKALGTEWGKIYSVCIHFGETRKLTALIKSSTQFIVEEEKCQEKPDVVVNSEEQIEHLVESDEHSEEQIEYNLEAAEHQEEPPEARETSEDSRDLKNEIDNPKETKGVWLHDDKWKQLEDIFPRIHPFGDEREFLSIKPKDFVVLTKEYQCLANNSFLLHGFYNYHHIILGKLVDRVDGNSNTEKFYIGVPGVFYEREKAVALMFGFESFGCSKEPAETGTFGYYMKRVEI